MRTSLRLLAVLFCALIPAAPHLSGSGPTGTILGTIWDTQRRIIPNAKVTVQNLGTHALRETVADGRGNYMVTLLPPGNYTVTVEGAGFQRTVRSDQRLEVEQALRIDFTLVVGDINETVVVTEAAPLTQPDTSSTGQVIGKQMIAALPLNERNFLGFTLLVPGAQLPSDGSQDSAAGGAISVNGAREQSNNFLLDGVDNNDQCINQYTALPSVDAIQEFKVQSSTSSAEFGRSGGAQINVVLKSGTNRFHGALFEYLRNRKLDAKNYFDQPDCRAGSIPGTCAEIPRYDRSQFGGTLGGPIRRDKTFFFLGYEGLRLRQAVTRQATVPSQLERNSALANVPATHRNASGVAVLNLLPAANVGSDLNNSNQYVAAPVLHNTTHQLSIKIDHVLSRKDQLSAHYTLFDENRFNPFDPLYPFTNLPGYGSFTVNRGQNVGVTWTRAFSGNLINEFRLGFNRMRGGIFQQNNGTSRSSELGFPDILTKPIDLGFPNVLLPGYDSVGEPTNLPLDRWDNTFHYSDSVSWKPGWNSGRHILKIGMDIRGFQMNSYLDSLARGEWAFYGGSYSATSGPFEDLLAGLPSFAISVKGDTIGALRTTGFNAFVQDDIRVNPRFTINLGLRYEYNSPPIDKYDQLYVPDLSDQALTCTPLPDCQFLRAGTRGIPRATIKPDRNNFAPRFGFAWRPLASDRFVVRAAYGVFYDVTILNINFCPRWNPPVFSTLFYPQNGNDSIQSILEQQRGTLSPLPSMLDPHYRDAYMQQWNLNFQFEPARDLVVEAAYTGSKGTKLARGRDINQPRPGNSGLRPYPAFGGFYYYEPTALSNYHAMQLRAERRFSRGLTFLASYTWSRSIDDASAFAALRSEPMLPQDSYDLGAERGLSNFNANHRLVVSHVYQLPLGKGQRRLSRGWINWLAGGWTIGGIWSFQSGHPFTVWSAQPLSDTSSDLGVFDRPNAIADPFEPGKVAGNPNCQAPDRVRTAAAWFNPCAFVAPSPAGFGNLGRNSLIGPGFRNVDLMFSKDFPLRREGSRLTLRAEIFNIANHPNFDLPNTFFVPPADTSAPFMVGSLGVIQSANAYGNRPPRQIQLGLRFTF